VEGWLFRGYLALGLPLIAVYLLVPAGLPRAPVYIGLGMGSAVAIALGIRHYRPARASPWWMMSAGMFAWSFSDAVYIWYDDVLGIDPFPSIADVGYLLAYPLLGIGFMVLIRSRRSGPDWEGLIDSLVFTVALALLCWVFVMRSIVGDAEASILERVIAAAYPLGDVLVMGMLLRLLTTPGSRTMAFRYLLGAGVLLLIADVAFQIATLHTSYDASQLDLLYMGSYQLWGAAALHPSMRTLSEPAPESESMFGSWRLIGLTVASLVAPLTLALQLITGSPLDAWPVVVSSVILFLLVVTRMAGLLRRVQEQADQLAYLAQIDALTALPNRRTADAELVNYCRQSSANARELVVAMIDLDRFKVFNDTFGHPEGDRLLRESAAAWQARIPEGEGLMARYGGEEFLLILSGRSVAEVIALVDLLRASTPSGQTFSAGVAGWDGRETPTELLARADVALYTAKRAGRDRVIPAQRAPIESREVPPERSDGLSK
jgi:diguanylate cyclase (GGDEF)-like protein